MDGISLMSFLPLKQKNKKKKLNRKKCYKENCDANKTGRLNFHVISFDKTQ